MNTSISEARFDLILSRHDVLADVQLSRFQKILLLTDGSVTELLSIYAGREIRTRKIEQFTRSGTPKLLGVSAEINVLHRKILLTDQSVNYVYAESIFVLDRLSKSTCAQLFSTDTPIGSLWKEEKAEIHKEIFDMRITHKPDIAFYFGASGNVPLLSRSYLIMQGGQALGMITEEFPATSFKR